MNYSGASSGEQRIFQAPPLPEYYVGRPEDSQKLKTHLLTNSSDVRTLVVTAIHGLGSVGKSTLATALAHDPEVQTHFGDGILWATLSQQPNLLSLLSDWIQALGDYNFKATSVEAASNQLRTLLYDKAVLLVVDDAWNTGDVQAFNVGGARCQVLVTTREAVIAKVLGANTYSLDVMKPSQAMELLTKKLERNLTDTETQLAEALAKEVGYLPLALELAAAQVADGTSWTVLLQDMQQEVARLKTLDDPQVRDTNDEAILKRFSLTASLNLSIQRLSKETRENFIWLGILPEDVNIAQKITAILWDIGDERDAADELRYLHSKALLLSGVPLASGTPTYRLHDLFHDLARNLLTAQPNPKRSGDLPGLGITLPAAHATFLKKYQNLTDKNLWHTLPNDGYIHQHLVWHLEKAQKVEEIHSLLKEDSKTGNNGWYEACDRIGQTAIFVADVARAWQLAEDLTRNETTLPQVIGLQCRYALIIASLNSLAANVPVELLIALVQKKVWTSEQGLAYVLQSSNPRHKANLLTKLVNHLPQNLIELGLSKVLAAAREIKSGEDRANALNSLAALRPELLPEVLAAAREIHDKYYRADALSSFAALMPELLPEALAAAMEIQSESSRANVLSSLAPLLPRELLPEALTAARQIKSESSRANVLSSLAGLMPELLPEALAAVREIKSESSRADALSSLAPLLPRELLPEALTAARQIKSESSRADALSSLAGLMPELLPEALAAVREIKSGEDRANALSSLAPLLPPELLPEALTAARQIQSESSRADALSSLTGLMPELLPEALTAAMQIQSGTYRADALSSLAPLLPPELLPEALAAAMQIQSGTYRADALSSLAPLLPPELLHQALTAVRAIQDDFLHVDTLSNLAALVPELLPEVLAAARQIQDEFLRAYALSSLAPLLSKELLPEALAAAKEIKLVSSRAYALSSLVPLLPPGLLTQPLAAARQIKLMSSCAYALTLSSLTALVPVFLLKALDEQIKFRFLRADALSSLAPLLSKELLPEALAAAKEIKLVSSRAYALSS
ncbi:NB-ARC domain-containing protein, partial [Nostoc sp.]|uniref:NB-ARC domain-containing protein n=1 Tax=Nostoc sp. TaxID=1180 RepID=UPI002FF6640B